MCIHAVYTHTHVYLCVIVSKKKNIWLRGGKGTVTWSISHPGKTSPDEIYKRTVKSYSFVGSISYIRRERKRARASLVLLVSAQMSNRRLGNKGKRETI